MTDAPKANNRIIYKYSLEIADEVTLKLPRGADILDAQFQNGQFFIWALVNTDREETERSIRIIGTGNPIGESDFCNIFLPCNKPDLFGIFLKLLI